MTDAATHKTAADWFARKRSGAMTPAEAAELDAWLAADPERAMALDSVELMWAAVLDHSPDPKALVMLGVWTVALAALAALAYRRDEGRRFR